MPSHYAAYDREVFTLDGVDSRRDEGTVLQITAEGRDASRRSTSRQANERLAGFGPNDPAPSRSRSRVIENLLLFLNPLVIILLLAAAGSAFLGQLVDSVIIAVRILIAHNYVQT